MAPPDAWEAWAFLGPSGGDDAGARITADPTTTPVAISLEPTTPAHPTGLRSPSSWGSLPQSWAFLGIATVPRFLFAPSPGPV
jgi:hypothetical protein